MFKTTTDLGPIPDEMTKDADKDHTISPLPPAVSYTHLMCIRDRY